MNTAHLTVEELINYIYATVDERTELEMQLVQELIKLLDKQESFGVHD